VELKENMTMLEIYCLLVELLMFEGEHPKREEVAGRTYTFHPDHTISVHAPTPGGGLGDFYGVIDVRECLCTVSGVAWRPVKGHLLEIVKRHITNAPKEGAQV